MSKKYGLYLQAIQQLEEAVSALDQAHASLKEIGMQDLDSGSGLYRQSLRRVCNHADGLLENLKASHCEDCNHPLIEGPCGCNWLRDDTRTNPNLELDRLAGAIVKQMQREEIN